MSDFIITVMLMVLAQVAIMLVVARIVVALGWIPGVEWYWPWQKPKNGGDI